MDSLIKNLKELSALLKAGNFVPPRVKTKPAQTLPSIKTPKAPSMIPKKPSAPKLPGIKPSSSKDPKKMAEQLKNPTQRAAKIKSIEVLKTDSQGQWKIEKADTGDKTPTVPSTVSVDHDPFTKVHATEDALPGGFAPNPEQHKLIHGLDFNTGQKSAGGSTVGSAWLKSPHHQYQVLTKPASGTNEMVRHGIPGFKGPDSMNSARREVLYHNLANDLFGMGKYVPTTSAFSKNGDEWSAQKMAGAQHGRYEKPGIDREAYGMKPKYKEALEHMHNNGELHKLALMDNMMGNHDRHWENIMVDNAEPKLHMIDNGVAFDYGNYLDKFEPDYMLDSRLNLGHQNKELHPEAKKWLNSIDEDKAKDIMKKHGFDENSRFTQGLLKRIKGLKESSSKPYNSVADLMYNNRLTTGPHRQRKKAG
jgi:hypothetical protein